MKLALPKDVLGNLPAPDSQGLVRVKVAVRLGSSGEEAEIVEFNGSPLPSDGDDDANPMPSDALPDLDKMEADIHNPAAY